MIRKTPFFLCIAILYLLSTAEAKDSFDVNDSYPFLKKVYEFSAEKGPPEDAEAWRKSLSKDDCIMAVQEINRWIIDNKKASKPEPGDVGWEGAAGYLTYGFVGSYFSLWPDESPKPFLDMAADKMADIDFRQAMLDILGDNDFYTLKQKHLIPFSEILLDITADKETPVPIKREALDCLSRSISRLFFQKINPIEVGESRRLDEILKLPQAKMSAESLQFFESLAGIFRKEAEVLLSMTELPMTFWQRVHFAKRMDDFKDSGFVIDTTLIDKLGKQADKLRKENETCDIKLVQNFLNLLKAENRYILAIKQVEQLIAEKFNYNGVLYSKEEFDNKSLLYRLQNCLYSPGGSKTIGNYQLLLRPEYSRWIDRSKYTEKYRLNSNDISRMVYFEIRLVFKESDKEIVSDVVFVGIDEQDKISAWLD